MSRPDLRIVGRSAIAPTAVKPVAPERRLRTLFRKEARLLAELADVRNEQAATRVRYGAKHQLLMLPSMERLRRLFA